MRIASTTLFEAGIARLGEGQANLVRLQTQISSGKKLLTPSDDPIASARIVELSQQQAQNAQFATNRQTMDGVFAQSEGVLSSVTSLLQNVQLIAINAGNATLNNADRKSMATTLSANFDQLIALANSRDAAGNSIFAGFQSGGAAFTATATGAVYNGDQGRVMVQVDSARQMAANIPGDELFQGGGSDLFQALSSLRDVLATPISSPAGQAAFDAGLRAAQEKVSAGLENVTTIRSTLGANMLELSDLDSIGDATSEVLTKTRAELESLDYADALTKLSTQKTVLEAAQATYAKVAGMSLFNYL